MKDKLLKVRDLFEEAHRLRFDANTFEKSEEKYAEAMSELAEAWSDATQMSGNQMLATFEEGTDKVYVELFKDGKSMGDVVGMTTTKLAVELVKNTRVK